MKSGRFYAKGKKKLKISFDKVTFWKHALRKKKNVGRRWLENIAPQSSKWFTMHISKLKAWNHLQ
jgi:hypothetical protein